MDPVQYVERPALDNALLNALFAAAWPAHEDRDFQPALARSLVYLGVFDDQRLVGFVNVAWDGGLHAFLLDPTVHPAWRHRGIGLELVRRATAVAAVRGLEWLHVDYDPELAPFYMKAGFRSTPAGLIRLADVAIGESGGCNR